MPRSLTILLYVATVCAILYFGWTLYVASVQALWNLQTRAAVAEAKVQQCKQW